MTRADDLVEYATKEAYDRGYARGYAVGVADAEARVIAVARRIGVLEDLATGLREAREKERQDRGERDSEGESTTHGAPPGDAIRRDRSAVDVERWMEAVSDSLAATTEGTDYAEAPEPSDEPGSPYVRRLTNELLSRLYPVEP